MIPRAHERGQSLVLFVLLLLVLVGAAGVLIDGGFAWGNRRQAQTAADMAALAAVRAKMDGGSVTSAAETMAAANGFPAGTTTCGATSRSGVIVNNPPAGGWTAPVNLDPDTSHYIEVIVNRRMDTAFAAAVGFDCFMVSARAVARFGATTTGLPGTPYPAILAQNACNGSAVDIAGNNLTVVGDVWSNSGIYDPGNGTIVTPPSTMNYAPSPSSGCGPYPPPVPSNGDSYSTTSQLAGRSYPVTYTFNTAAHTITNDVTLASASCTSFTSGNLTIGSAAPAPGIYCATGNITLNGNQTIGNVTLIAGGKIEATGSAPYNLTAFWDNLLAFSTQVGTPSQPVITFNNGLTFVGLIYAPNGSAQVTGNFGATSNGAVWGQTVRISGNSWTLTNTNLGSSSSEVTTFEAGTLVE